MKKSNSIIWGILLIVTGVVFSLNAFDIININLFFDGWWTLFIIVPSIISLFTDIDKTVGIIGICVGTFWLLYFQDILTFSMLWKLLVPAVIIIIGVKLLLKGLSKKQK